MVEPQQIVQVTTMGGNFLDQKTSLSTSSFSLVHLSAYCRLSNRKELELLQKTALEKACW